MPTVSDARFDALRNQGFTGATSDMILQWLHANGATSGSIPDAWYEMLELRGYTEGTRNDKWYQLLGDSGYTGALPDRELAYWLDGGLTGSLFFFNGTDQYATHAAWTILGESSSYPPQFSFVTDNPDGNIVSPLVPVGEFGRSLAYYEFDGATSITIPAWTPTGSNFEIRATVTPRTVGSTALPVVGGPYRLKLRINVSGSDNWWQCQYSDTGGNNRAMVAGDYVEDRRIEIVFKAGTSAAAFKAETSVTNVAPLLAECVIDRIGDDEWIDEFARGVIQDVYLTDYDTPSNSRHYPIDEGTGTVINDVIGGQNGTLNGSAGAWVPAAYHSGSIANIRYTDTSPLVGKKYYHCDVDKPILIPSISVQSGVVQFDMIYESGDQILVSGNINHLSVVADKFVMGAQSASLQVDDIYYTGWPLVNGQHYRVKFLISTGTFSQVGGLSGIGALSLVNQG